MGAKGLMQVIPKFHPEKLLEHGGEPALLDPEVNIQVGAQILREYLRRFGETETALQMYAGAFDEPTSGYAVKVLAEHARLEQMLKQLRRDRDLISAGRTFSGARRPPPGPPSPAYRRSARSAWFRSRRNRSPASPPPLPAPAVPSRSAGRPRAASVPPAVGVDVERAARLRRDLQPGALQRGQQEVAPPLEFEAPLLQNLQGPAEKQASAACWAAVGAQMNRCCASFSNSRTRAAGSTTQPRRQPVMQKYFEKLLTRTTSPGSPSALAGRLPYTSPW